MDNHLNNNKTVTDVPVKTEDTRLTPDRNVQSTTVNGSRNLKKASREHREKKDSLKKREATNGSGASTDANHASTRGQPLAELPVRYNVPDPKPIDFEAPKDPVFLGGEAAPKLTPDGTLELKKPADQYEVLPSTTLKPVYGLLIAPSAENKRAYRYSYCVADPLFPHKQYYRQSEARPYGPRMSFEDSDPRIHFDASATIVTNEKGWRMSRANVVAREGRLYYEVKIIKGVPAGEPKDSRVTKGLPMPHIRMGWARREAPLDAPVGFDGYSYGVTDIRFETMHRSRPRKILRADAEGKLTKPTAADLDQQTYASDDNVLEGDVVGLEIELPSLRLQRKIASGNYNPAVDTELGTVGYPDNDDKPDIVRDRIPVPYKGNLYFEQMEYQATKGMDQYNDRGPSNNVTPTPNHADASLRSLPGSAIRVYKNGELVGTAFRNLISFLPPASQPSAASGARVGLDDGMLGYYPAVTSFSGGIAQMNFGPNFWKPPSHVKLEDAASNPSGTSTPDCFSSARPIGVRYQEQIAEDIVYDLVDEVSFFMEDGGIINQQGQGAVLSNKHTIRGLVNLSED